MLTSDAQILIDYIMRRHEAPKSLARIHGSTAAFQPIARTERCPRQRVNLTPHAVLSCYHVSAAYCCWSTRAVMQLFCTRQQIADRAGCKAGRPHLSNARKKKEEEIFAFAFDKAKKLTRLRMQAALFCLISRGCAAEVIRTTADVCQRRFRALMNKYACRNLPFFFGTD